MTLQVDSLAGKIREALSQLGWDAPASEVAKAVGPVNRFCQDVDAFAVRVPTDDYVNLTRRKFRHMEPKLRPIPIEVYEWM